MHHHQQIPLFHLLYLQKVINAIKIIEIKFIFSEFSKSSFNYACCSYIFYFPFTPTRMWNIFFWVFLWILWLNLLLGPFIELFEFICCFWHMTEKFGCLRGFENWKIGFLSGLRLEKMLVGCQIWRLHYNKLV